jgi:hypothetical protein
MSRAHRRLIQNSLVDFIIDDTLARSGKLRRLNRRVLRAQEELRRLVDDAAWGAYLRLEAVTNARGSKQLELVFERMLVVLARAFELGCACPTFDSAACMAALLGRDERGMWRSIHRPTSAVR